MYFISFKLFTYYFFKYHLSPYLISLSLGPQGDRYLMPAFYPSCRLALLCITDSCFCTALQKMSLNLAFSFEIFSFKTTLFKQLCILGNHFLGDMLIVFHYLFILSIPCLVLKPIKCASFIFLPVILNVKLVRMSCLLIHAITANSHSGCLFCIFLSFFFFNVKSESLENFLRGFCKSCVEYSVNLYQLSEFDILKLSLQLQIFHISQIV